jgi:tRNA pseudouridine55 synthase
MVSIYRIHAPLLTFSSKTLHHCIGNGGFRDYPSRSLASAWHRIDRPVQTVHAPLLCASMKRSVAGSAVDPTSEQLAPHNAANAPKRKKLPPAPRVVSPTDQQDAEAGPDIWQSAMLLVDKPKTWTSFDVCGKIRGELGRALGVKPKKIKVGHAGTLDPMATGLLIVCVGKGTKSIETFMGMKKEYSGTMKLGEVTDSYDAEGDVVSSNEWGGVSNRDLESLVEQHFIGEIDQVPPMFSALKQGGKKLCDLAREGKEVERKARGIVVEKFDIAREDEGAQFVDYYVVCSKGTYIRCLAHDLGQRAGCGAHLVALRREKIGEFDVKEAWQVDDLVEFIKQTKKEETKKEETKKEETTNGDSST